MENGGLVVGAYRIRSYHILAVINSYSFPRVRDALNKKSPSVIIFCTFATKNNTMRFINQIFNKITKQIYGFLKRNSKSLHEIADDIVVCKQDGDLVSCYLNERALNKYIFERARISTHNFTRNTDLECEKHKKNITLRDIRNMHKYIRFLPERRFDKYIEVDTLTCVLSLGGKSQWYCDDNNISTINTRLSADIPVFSKQKGLFSESVKKSHGFDMVFVNNGDLLYQIKLCDNKSKEIEQFTSGMLTKYKMVFDYNMLPRNFVEQVNNIPRITCSNLLPNDLEYVNKGDDLIQFLGHSVNKPSVFSKYLFKSPVSGYILISDINGDDLKQGMLLCVFYKDKIDLHNDVREKYSTQISKDKLYKQNADHCCVYLMKDTTNMNYKIGISNKPEYRERTLQSEKPSIEMVCYKLFPSRKIARAIESALHKTYLEKNIRGEWFMLDSDDVLEIVKTLS